jgi:prepilin-type N-terminal cleavage/methylation domain-containing protein
MALILKSESGKLAGKPRSRASARRSRSGFTLVELLVVVSIMAIMSTYVATYFRSSQPRLTLYAEQQKIASLIFKAKSLAMESFVETSKGNCGYGLAMDYANSGYYIFYYTTSTASNQPKSVQCPAIKQNGKLDATQIKPFSDATTLSQGLSFPSNSFLNSQPDILYYILFVPPNPTPLILDKTYKVILDKNNKAISGSIYLQTADGSVTSTVSVNTAGGVDFSD